MQWQVRDFQNYKAGTFHCMGGLCEVLIETDNSYIANELFENIYKEAKRIELKFSRYVENNVVYQINHANGKKIKIDSEVYKLLNFADNLFKASNGLYDLTSGVLRKIWKFDGSNKIPNENEVSLALKKIGWNNIKFDKNYLQIPKDWEIDFGGIGKEYAVDVCVELAKVKNSPPLLVNFGGDIAVTGKKSNNQPWIVNIEDSEKKLFLFKGAVATSGDKNKYIMYKGKKLPHILNPKTARPVEGSPRSVTVIADTCSAAGALSTIAILQGQNAERFLKQEADDFVIEW